MGKRKIFFERIRLSEIQDLVTPPRAGNERPPNAEDAKKVKKLPARTQRSIRTEGQDHPVGLWIDKEIFRKHQNRPPQILLSDGFGLKNRHLTLADLEITSAKQKTKKRESTRGDYD